MDHSKDFQDLGLRNGSRHGFNLLFLYCSDLLNMIAKLTGCKSYKPHLVRKKNVLRGQVTGWMAHVQGPIELHVTEFIEILRACLETLTNP